MEEAEGSIKDWSKGIKISDAAHREPVRLGRATESKRTEQWRLEPGTTPGGAEPGAWLGQPAPQGPADGHYLGTRNTRNTAQGGHSFGRARVLCRRCWTDRLGTEEVPGKNPRPVCVGPKSPV